MDYRFLWSPRIVGGKWYSKRGIFEFEIIESAFTGDDKVKVGGSNWSGTAPPL